MKFLRIFLWQSGLTALLITLFMAPVYAQDVMQLLDERYAPGSIDTTQRAKAALEEVVDARVEVDRQYANQRKACFDRFFATFCMNDVREKQRAALSKIRKIEVEANAFLRKEKADERDRALAERDVRAKQQPERSLPISGKVRKPGAEIPGAEIPGAEIPGAEIPSAEIPSAEIPSAEIPSAPDDQAPSNATVDEKP